MGGARRGRCREHLVAIDAEHGTERWRFKPEGRPAFRGLIYWPGRDGLKERVLFCAGPFLYALDPVSGAPIFLTAVRQDSAKAKAPADARPGCDRSTAGQSC